MLCKLCKKNEVALRSKWRCESCLKKNAESAAQKRNQLKTENLELYLENQRAYGKQRRESNREKIRAYHREYMKSENGKKIRKRDYEKNKEKYIAYKKDWDKKNPEKLIAYYKKYNTTHQPRLVAHASRRKRLKEENGGNFTYEQWVDVCNRFDNSCVWCGEKKTLTVDHVVPLTKGGKNNIENIQPLCKSCNSRKNNRIIDFRPFGNFILEWT